MIEIVVAMQATAIIFLMFGFWFIWDEYQNTYEDVKELMNELIINNGNVNEKMNDIIELDLENSFKTQKKLNEIFSDYIKFQRAWNKASDEATVQLFKTTKGVRK